MHCRLPSSSQRAQNALLGLSVICACNNRAIKMCQFGASHFQWIMNRLRQSVSHHFAKGLMIWGWSQMNVGLIQVTSRKSPTNCGKTSLMTSSKCWSRQTVIHCVKYVNGAPYQGGGQWFWEEDIQLLSEHTGRQRIYESLKTKLWKREQSNWL